MLETPYIIELLTISSITQHINTYYCPSTSPYTKLIVSSRVSENYSYSYTSLKPAQMES